MRQIKQVTTIKQHVVYNTLELINLMVATGNEEVINLSDPMLNDVPIETIKNVLKDEWGDLSAEVHVIYFQHFGPRNVILGAEIIMNISENTEYLDPVEVDYV